MGSQRILLLGNLKGAPKAALEGACRQLGAVLTSASRADDAIREIDHREWYAVFVDITTPGASRFCHEARARRALFNVPMLGLTPQPSDLAFANALRWGADDVVPFGSAQAITARLESLLPRAPLTAPQLGEAVIADSDRSRCDVLGRVLANAGYHVRYATDIVTTRFYLTKSNVRLFVLNHELGSAAELISEARNAGNQSPWVITAKQLDLLTLRTQLAEHSGVAVMSSHGPPENVLFALDFLNPSEHAQQRAEVRALYGTMVLFRPEGETEDECGYSYSISARGLYVRTLAPAPSERLWVELEPPNAGRRVRLTGEVVWSRRFGELGEQTAPPGFGVRLLSGLGNDMDAWLSGFQTLAGATPDTHRVPEVKITSPAFRVPLPSTLSLRPSPQLAASVAPGKIKQARIISVHSSDEIPAVKPPAPSVTPAAPPAASPPTEAALVETALPETAPAKTISTETTPAEAVLAETAPAEAISTKTAQLEPSTAAVEPVEEAALLLVTAKPAFPKNAELADTEPAADAEPAAAAEPTAQPAAAVKLAPEPTTKTTARPAASAQPLPHAHVGARRSDRPTPPVSSSAPNARVRPAIPAAIGLFVLLTVAGVVAVTNDWLPLNLSAQSDSALRGSRSAGTEQQRRVSNLSKPPLASGADQPVTNTPRSNAPQSGVNAQPATPNEAAATEVALDATGSNPASVETATPTPSEPAPAHPSAPNTALLDSNPAASELNTAPSVLVPNGADLKPGPPEPGADSLADDESWLLVRSSLTANVFVHGLHHGSTNEWIRSKCGMRFIRLGRLLGDWISDGVPQKLPCKGRYVMQLEKSEPPKED